MNTGSCVALINFIIPIRHPENMRDQEVWRSNLAQTLSSIENQSIDHWRVTLVANTGTPFPTLPEKVHVIEVKNAPNPLHDDRTNKILFYDAVRQDKGGRLLKGIQGNGDCTYHMFVDDDDFLHKDICKYVSSQPDIDLFTITKGYAWQTGSDVLLPVNSFNKYCGTTHVLSNDSANKIFSGTKDVDDRVRSLLGSHYHLRDFCQSNGYRVKDIEFRAAVYRVANPNSHSRVEHSYSKHWRSIVSHIRHGRVRDAFELAFNCTSIGSPMGKSFNIPARLQELDHS